MNENKNNSFLILRHHSCFYSPYVYCGIITAINHVSSTRTKSDEADCGLTPGV